VGTKNDLWCIHDRLPVYRLCTDCKLLDNHPGVMGIWTAILSVGSLCFRF
jgi:hypothetical protein